MGATGHFVHRIKNAVSVEYSSSYDTNRVIKVNLNADITDGGNANSIKSRIIYSGNIQLIRLKGTLNGGATSITLKGYEDANGNDLLLPASSSTFENAVTSGDVSVVFKVDIFHAAPTDEMYIFCKTNSGTFTVSEVQVAWYE